MKGYRSILIWVGVGALGLIDQFVGIMKSCAVDATTHVELCSAGVPSWVVTVLAGLGLVLRFITTTPVGTK